MRIRFSQVKPTVSHYTVRQRFSNTQQSGFLTACRRLGKLVLPSVFDPNLSSFMMWNLQLSDNSFKWMKECDILGGSKHTLTPPTYFQGSRPQPPGCPVTPLGLVVKIPLKSCSPHRHHRMIFTVSETSHPSNKPYKNSFTISLVISKIYLSSPSLYTGKISSKIPITESRSGRNPKIPCPKETSLVKCSWRSDRQFLCKVAIDRERQVSK